MSGLVGAWLVPELPADPVALSDAAEAVKTAVGTIEQETADAVSSWSALAEGYDTPDTPELVARMGLVAEAGIDFRDALVASPRHS